MSESTKTTKPEVAGRGGINPETNLPMDENFVYDAAIFYRTTASLLNKMFDNNGVGSSLDWEYEVSGNFQFKYNLGGTSAPAGSSKVELLEIQRGNLGYNQKGLEQTFTAVIPFYDSVIQLQLQFQTSSNQSSLIFANIILDGVTQTNGWFSDDNQASFSIKGSVYRVSINIDFSLGSQGYDNVLFTFTQSY